jgi:hypothetical protein
MEGDDRVDVFGPAAKTWRTISTFACDIAYS